MPQITISDQTYARVAEFKQVVEAVIDDELELDDCLEAILHRGIDLMLAELLGQLEPEVLLATIQKLGARHPGQVYGFVAEVLKLGADVQQRSEMAERFGFHPPDKNEVPEQSEDGPAYDVKEIRKEHARAYEKWTPEDDDRLRELVRAGHAPKEIATILKRQPSAIRSRLSKLGLQPDDGIPF